MPERGMGARTPHADLPRAPRGAKKHQHLDVAVRDVPIYEVATAVTAGPSLTFFVPGLPHVTLIELRPALIAYQDYHMLP